MPTPKRDPCATSTPSWPGIIRPFCTVSEVDCSTIFTLISTLTDGRKDIHSSAMEGNLGFQLILVWIGSFLFPHCL